MPALAAPWSPAKISTCGLFSIGDSVFWMRPILKAIFSNCPNEPSGLVLLSILSRSAASSALLTGLIANFMIWSSFKNGIEADTSRHAHCRRPSSAERPEHCLQLEKTKRAPAGGTSTHASSRSPFQSSALFRHVFWLPDQPKRCAFPSRSAPTVAGLNQAAFVPGYSGGPATELHRVPFIESIGAGIFYAAQTAVNRCRIRTPTQSPKLISTRARGNHGGCHCPVRRYDP